MPKRSDPRGSKGDPMYENKSDYEDEDEEDDDDDPRDLRNILGSKASTDSEDNASEDGHNNCGDTYEIDDDDNDDDDEMLEKIVEDEDEEKEEEIESKSESDDNGSEDEVQKVLSSKPISNVSSIPPPPSTKTTLPSIPPPPSVKPVLPSVPPPPTSKPKVENTSVSQSSQFNSEKDAATPRRKKRPEKKSASSNKHSAAKSSSSDASSASVSQSSFQTQNQQRTDKLGRNSNPSMACQNSVPQPCECPRSHEEVTEEIMGLAMEGKSREKVRQIGQWILQGHDVNACAGTTTLLDTACCYCFLPLLEALVSSPHLHLNYKDHLGRTPLMMASIWYDPFNGGTSEQAVELITSANTNCVLDYGAKDEDGKTALIHAAENKRWGSVIILLERFKLHDIRSLVTAMFLALEGGAIDVIRYLQKNYKERLDKVSLQTAASLYVDKMGYATS